MRRCKLTDMPTSEAAMAAAQSVGEVDAQDDDVDVDAGYYLAVEMNGKGVECSSFALAGWDTATTTCERDDY
jgi:hypothetical protein